LEKKNLLTENKNFKFKKDTAQLAKARPKVSERRIRALQTAIQVYKILD
jgi:hypothetical protein